jgi:hypothetical protein
MAASTSIMIGSWRRSRRRRRRRGAVVIIRLRHRARCRPAIRVGECIRPDGGTSPTKCWIYEEKTSRCVLLSSPPPGPYRWAIQGMLGGKKRTRGHHQVRDIMLWIRSFCVPDDPWYGGSVVHITFRYTFVSDRCISPFSTATGVSASFLFWGRGKSDTFSLS